MLKPRKFTVVFGACLVFCGFALHSVFVEGPLVFQGLYLFIFFGFFCGVWGVLGALRRVARGAHLGPPYRRDLLFWGLLWASGAAVLSLLVFFLPSDAPCYASLTLSPLFHIVGAAGSKA